MDRNTLEAKTVAELRELAAQLDISGRSRLRKPQLVRAILSAAPPAADPVPVEPAVQVSAEVTAASLAVQAADPTPDPEPLVAARAQAPPAAPAVETADEIEPVDDQADAETEELHRVEVEAATEDDTGPTEPDGSVYIDRGAVLPEAYPGTRARAMVRDPGTVYVYWEPDPPRNPSAWEVTAFAGGQPLTSFRVSGAGRDGYLHVAVADIEAITVRAIEDGVYAERPSLRMTRPVEAAHEGGTEVWLSIEDQAFSGAPEAVAQGRPVPLPARPVPAAPGAGAAASYEQAPFTPYRPGH